MWGAAGAAPLAVSLLEPVVQGQLKGLLLPPARCPALLLALPPAACLLPGVGLLLEVAGEAVLDVLLCNVHPLYVQSAVYYTTV